MRDPISKAEIERIKSLHASRYSQREIIKVVKRDRKTILKILFPEKPKTKDPRFFNVDEFSKLMAY